MSFENERLVVLYGSQTGNSQDLAERVWRESKRYHFVGVVSSMDDYDVLQLVNERCAIFICSTTGQGEEPDNMKNFWRFLLRKGLPENSLSNLRYAVLGLGDSSYIKFNFVAKRLNKRLAQLGGQALVPLGLGDEQHDLGYDAVADPWIESLFSGLLAMYPLPAGVSSLERHQAVKPRWKVTRLLESKPIVGSIYYSTRPPSEFTVTVKENTRVTSESHYQDVRLIKFRTNGEHYNPGDVVSLRPRNLPSQVEYFKNVLKDNGVNIPADAVFKISEISPELPVPPHLQHYVTFQQLCEEYFDLTAIPRRRAFEILAQLTDSELEKDKCLEFTTAEGQDDLYTYCNRPRRNIVEVLEDFRHATKNLTIDILFELLPPIRPRDFSIASSRLFHGNEIHILVAVVQYRTKLFKERLGLCSNYLAGLSAGDKLSVRIKKGSFRFPHAGKNPLIMVGPGTGVAPFRNYIYECIKTGSASSDNLLLFFGCRYKDQDFYCSDLKQFHDEGQLKLITAFSRDQPSKVYVQDKIIENAEIVRRVLTTKDAQVFVAGNSKGMPQEVREAFVKVLTTNGTDKTDADRFVTEMERTNRYQTETWS